MPPLKADASMPLICFSAHSSYTLYRPIVFSKILHYLYKHPNKMGILPKVLSLLKNYTRNITKNPKWKCCLFLWITISLGLLVSWRTFTLGLEGEWYRNIPCCWALFISHRSSNSVLLRLLRCLMSFPTFETFLFCVPLIVSLRSESVNPERLGHGSFPPAGSWLARWSCVSEVVIKQFRFLRTCR